jgi:hypothetical protein
MGAWRARNLPETALRVTSRRSIRQPSTAPFTCPVAWVGEAAHVDVNHRRIDGKDGVAGSIPAGGSTKPMTSANADHLGVPDRSGRPYGGWKAHPMLGCDQTGRVVLRSCRYV